VIGALALLGPVLPGGVPTPSALRPASPQAAGLEGLWQLMLWTTTAVFVLVLAALAIALLRPKSPEPRSRRTAEIVTAAAAVSTVILFVFLIATMHTARKSPNDPRPTDRIVQIIGHQWWWEVHYPGDRSDLEVVTANEIHVPTGRAIWVDLSSDDVIHSFWAPALHGKTDLIPGHHNTQQFRVDRPGIFRGQCAEYCGYQHAHMAFRVVAEPQADFDRWLQAQRQAAPEPAGPLQERGRQVFLSRSCVLCHSIRGTPAFATRAPDLTHLASRETIAAATLPNTPGSLAGWVANSQGVKPGNHMPPNALPAPDLIALLSYLESLR
jgi:cytochrome c oxidase subunit II